MRFNLKKWIKLTKSPTYFDDDPDREYPQPELIIRKDGWEIYMEGDRVFWKHPLHMGDFYYQAKSFSNEGSEFPEEWDEWLVFLFLEAMRGYRKDQPKILTSLKYRTLLQWTD